MTPADYLTTILQTCDRHKLRLVWAMHTMVTWLPMTAVRFQSLTDEEVAVIEVFTNRFGKLQDIMGMKLFPLVLEITKEPGDYPAFIDKLNRLEKIGAITSVAQWLVLRQVRNQFAHDYPEHSEENAATINLAYSQATHLLRELERVREFVQDYSI